MNPQELLKWAFDKYGDKITFASSFSIEDMVIIDLISKINPKASIFTLDTGRLPGETYEIMDRVNKRYGLSIKVFFPDRAKVEELVNKQGLFSFRKTIDNRKECCYIRKVEPLSRALLGMDAWITGLRREQSENRANLSKVDTDPSNPGRVKINPLIDWSQDQVWEYISANNVPYNRLYDSGYQSIGCEPCTRAVKEGESERSGRWWWEHEETKECGIHVPLKANAFKVKFNAPPISASPKPQKEIISEYSMSRLDQLENKSIYIIREAYKKFRDMAMLWSIGKDSTVLMWLVRKRFFGKVPFPAIHCDTTFKFKEIIEFREKYAKEWGLDLIVRKNEEALKQGMNSSKGRFNCCNALKTNALQLVMDQYKFKALLVGIRRDEEGSRGKERYFSPRGKDFKWNYKEQPPELWDQFKTDVDDQMHMRVHPLLHWNELDIWEYIKRENIPTLSLYFAKDGKRYRSVGCEPCCAPVNSNAATIDEIISELKTTTVSERSGRAHDKEQAYMMQKLRTQGFM